MKRLFRVSIDIFSSSIMPILSFILLSLIFDNRLINLFSLTYPLQCIEGIIISIFVVGANICKYKENKTSMDDNGIFYGSIITIIITLLFIFFRNEYIAFMNLNCDIYNVFYIYSVLQIFLRTILELVLNKLYYTEQNKKANKITLVFNISYIVLTFILAVISKNELITMSFTSLTMILFLIYVVVKNISKIDFKFNIIKCLKYDSVSFTSNVFYFIIYFFGFSNAFVYGEEYVLAISFVSIVTDIQWDIDGSIKTVAKIDIAKNNFNYNYHLKSAYILTLFLILSVIFMSVLLYPIYNPNINIILIFLFLHILDFLITPLNSIKLCILQLEYSKIKTNINNFISYLIRTIISNLPTPFAVIIGQIASTSYDFVFTQFMYFKYKKIKSSKDMF